MAEGKNKYKILLVEDEANIAKLFSYTFKKEGYECIVAEDGAKGIEVLEDFMPDLIISDIMMPRMDGFEFRKKICETAEYKTIPFVFLTAKSEEEDILNAYDLEIEDYIVKTSSPKIVLAKLKSIIAAKEKEKKKALGEVEKAAGTFRTKVVPEDFPVFDGFEIKHWHVPYEEVPGGDFIDYFKINDDKLAVIMGDVMGKRWGAWYFAVAYAGYVRSAVRFVLQTEGNSNPSEILDKVNEAVFNDERIADIFITISIIILDKKEMKAYYSGASDLPVIYRTGSEVELIRSKGLPLGFKIEGDYDDSIINLKAGDELVCLTDGILESRNSEGEQFGRDRVMDTVKNNPDDCYSKIEVAIKNFTDGKYEDDISLITIKAL